MNKVHHTKRKCWRSKYVPLTPAARLRIAADLGEMRAAVRGVGYEYVTSDRCVASVVVSAYLRVERELQFLLEWMNAGIGRACKLPTPPAPAALVPVPLSDMEVGVVVRALRGVQIAVSAVALQPHYSKRVDVHRRQRAVVRAIDTVFRRFAVATKTDVARDVAAVPGGSSWRSAMPASARQWTTGSSKPAAWPRRVKDGVTFDVLHEQTPGVWAVAVADEATSKQGPKLSAKVVLRDRRWLDSAALVAAV